MVLKKLVFIGIVFLLMVFYSCSNQTSKAEQKPAPPFKATAEDIAAGNRMYKENCALCHGADGKKGAGGAKDLTVSELTQEQAYAVIAYGRGGMAPYLEVIFNEDEVNQVAAFVQTLKPAK